MILRPQPTSFADQAVEQAEVTRRKCLRHSQKSGCERPPKQILPKRSKFGRDLYEELDEIGFDS